MDIPYDQFVEAKNEILWALEKNTQLNWSELLQYSQLGKATLSKHLFELIEKGKVASTRGIYKGRRTTIYSILKEGEWESRRARIVKLLEGFKLPYVYENKDKENRLLTSLAFEFHDQTLQEKEILEKNAPTILGSKIMNLALRVILRSLALTPSSKMMLTIYFSPEPIK